jgi:hypothetical protein
MLISETNGRISELRRELEKRGITIESSSIKDAYGFRYQRLVAPKPIKSIAAAEMETWSNQAVVDFDAA